MGLSTSLLMPSWSAGAAAAAGTSSLPDARREKLLGLDYRVRKCLSRVIYECDESCDESLEEFSHAVIFHTEGEPQSLDRMRVVAAQFFFNLDDVAHQDGKVTSSHSVVLAPPAVEVPASVCRVPGVELTFSFLVERFAPAARLSRKAGIGRHASLSKLGVYLCIETDVSLAGRETDGAHTRDWSVLDECVVACASSPTFSHGVDAEVEGGNTKRWWTEREHERQRAREPLSPEVVAPRRPHAHCVDEGGAVLDLRRCSAERLAAPCLEAPWKVHGATRRSSCSVWALLSGRSTAAPHARMRACADVVRTIASFALEPAVYKFEADIWVGLALANF